MKINLTKLNEGNASSSNPRDFLKRATTVHKYYQSVLNNIKANKKYALNSIKEDGKEWRLKLQCGKYAHPLYIAKDENDKETTYPTASFETKEEAIDFFQDWIADLKSGTPGVVDAVNQAYTEWCKANGSTNQNLLDAYKEAV